MIFVKRLHPGEDLKQSIQQMADENQIEAGVVVSGVGSLTRLRIRCADGETIHVFDEHFEIVSLTGTVSKQRTHLHISAANTQMHTFGGHLCDGCVVNSTVEVAIMTLPNTTFSKEFDPETGFQELHITRGE